MDVKIFKFNGCNKCYNETILLNGESKYKVEFIEYPKNWKESQTDISIITGFLLPEDKEILDSYQLNVWKFF